jgi:hypothetical protein
MKVLTALRLVWRDLRRIAHGGMAFWHYLTSEERLDVGLGLFSTESPRVMKGRPCRYDVRIANASRKAQTVTLIIDIHAADMANRPGGHKAYLAKHLRLEPRAALTVEVHYDWLAEARFFVSGVPSSPDELRSTAGDGPQWSSVNARLLGPGGMPLDALTIYQELQG